MPWNGSGQFNRTDGVFTGPAIWEDNRDANVKIRADRHDTHDEDIATGLENVVTRDGQNSPSANLPMATFRHTNVGAAATQTDYASFGQVQDQVGIYVSTVGGTPNAITLAPAIAIAAYAAGQRFVFLPSGNNTGATTVNVSGLGAKDVQNQSGGALVAGDLQSGQLAEVTYDGIAFQLSVVAGGFAKLGADNTFTGATNTFKDVTLEDTDAGAAAGPDLVLDRDSASPAASDVLGQAIFRGKDSLGNDTDYATIQGEIEDPTDTSEDGRLAIRTITAGVEANRVLVGKGIYAAGATGGDPGDDKANFSRYQKNGTDTDAVQIIDSTTISSVQSEYDVSWDNANDYAKIEIEIRGLRPDVADELYLLTSSNGGATFDTGASDYGWHLFGAVNSVVAVRDDSDAQIKLTTTANFGSISAADDRARLSITIPSPAYANADAGITSNLSYNAGSGATGTVICGGWRKADAAINAVRLKFATNDIAEARIRVLGYF